MSFALDLKAFADKTSARTNMVVRKIILDVGTSVVMKSPVGDAKFWKSPPPPGYVGGRFRGNWQYGLNAPDLTTTMNIDPGGQATIDAFIGEVPKDPAGDIHYLTNSLAYGPRLEKGWSRQAPSGMVGLTVLEFQPIVDNAARAMRDE